MTRPGLARAVVVCALGLVVCGCSTQREGAPVPRPTATTATPQPSPTAPAGVSFTAPGAALRFGQPAVVPFTQNASRRTTLQLAVTAVRQGTPADLAAYTLDDAARAATPTYVDVTVSNLGAGDVGRAAVPLSAAVSDGSTLTPSGFTPAPAGCPSAGPPASLPSPFASGATVSTCLVFLVPSGTTLSSVDFRPAEGAPIAWRAAAPLASGAPRMSASPVR